MRPQIFAVKLLSKAAAEYCRSAERKEEQTKEMVREGNTWRTLFRDWEFNCDGEAEANSKRHKVGNRIRSLVEMLTGCFLTFGMKIL